MRHKLRLFNLILLVVFIFSFTACTTLKTATETTAAETTIPETTATETTVAVPLHQKLLQKVKLPFTLTVMEMQRSI